MVTAFDQATMLQHQDLVRVGDGRQPVRNGQRGTMLGNTAERGQDFLFGPAVERACRLVQQQDRRILHQRAGNGDALFLAAGEFQSALADFGIQPLGQALDQRHDRCRLCRGDHLFAPGAAAAIGDVVTDGVVEQHAILRDDPDLLAQTVLGNLCNILSVDQDAALLRVVEPEQQSPDRALARARRADDRNMTARRNLEAQPVQDRPVLLIPEHDIVEGNSWLADQQGRGAGSILYLGVGIDQAEHLCHVDQTLANCTIDHSQHVERTEKLDEIGVHQHQIPGGQRALAPLPDGEGHRCAHQQVHDDRLADVEQGQRVFGPDRRFGEGTGRFGVAVALARFRAEIFDRFVIQQAVHRPGEGRPVEFVHLPPQFVAPFGDRARDEDIRPYCQRGGGNQFPSEVEVEDDPHRSQFQRCGRDVEQQEVQHDIDALRPAIDGLGHFPGAARQVEPQR